MATVSRCVFCDLPFGPARPRSKEHAAPNWCKELLPDSGPAVHVHAVVTPGGRQDSEMGERDIFTTVCGDVCRPCDTGWMAELEESGRPFLTPLIQGQTRTQRYWRQTLTATWAANTAMVWDSVRPQHHMIPREVLHGLHRTQRLTYRQQVWIGRYVGSPPHHSFREVGAHVVGVVSDDAHDPNEAHAYLAAITVGELALVFYGHLLGVPNAHKLPGGVEQRVIQIWPPESEVLRWPPSEALDDVDIQTILVSLGEPMGGEGNIPIL
jgi:hypothetical protein